MHGRRTAILASALVAVSIAAAAVTSALFRAPQGPRNTAEVSAPTATVPGQQPAIQAAPGRPQLSELERLIRAFTQQTAETPNATGFAFLGQLELERARLTGDVAGYARAERALASAYEMAPADAGVGASLASVRFTTHDFTGAYALADRIYAESGEPGALAVRADAALELGRYDAALADYRQLDGLVPGTSAVRARLARVAFLRGDAEEATRLAKQAEEGARREGAFGATLAWYTAFRGKLALDGGRYDDALALYRRAAKIAPEYHVAIGGLAAATAAGGDIVEAIGLYRRAIRIVPDPVYLGALGDLYARSDRADLARQRYGAVDAIATIAATQRRAYDRQLALFWADHDRRLDDALEIARTSLEMRRDIYGYDTLAWVQFRLGELADARSASDRALALGTPDPRLWFHAGMISAALGEDERAARELSTALRLSPRFDALLSEAARTTLAGLTG